MGRRLNVSTPTVINTELVPLDESFYIDVDGQLEQWYYDNTEQYAPNRKVTPLLLVPVISAFDKDTNTSYDPTFNTTQWFESAYREDYSIRHDFGLSAHAQAETGREYPSDISSWLSFPGISFEAKPYLWHRITKTIGSSTTVTYELVQVRDTPAYVLGRALSYFPDDPEEEDMVVSTNANVDYYVYENGYWVDYYLNNGQAIDVADLKEIWVLVDDASYGKWYKIPYSSQNGGYIENEITNTVDSSSADYVIQGNNLLVKKNVSYSHAISIRCVATYIDPRDSGVTYAVEDSVNLTTNRTADVVFPEVDIISPSGRAYNPLVDDTNSQYDFKGVTTNNPVQPLNTDVRRYPVDVDGTEEILNSGEAVAPIMDIRYGENPTMEDQEFMYRQTADGELVGESIDKAYIERIKGNTVAWNQLVHGETEVYNSGSQFDNQPVNIIQGHKYYVIFTCDKEQDIAADFRLWYGASYWVIRNVAFGTKTYWLFGATAANDSQNFGVYVSSSADIQSNTFKRSNYMLFDLTLIYGTGNEPTSVAQFEADYERWFGKPLSYEEYDEGSLRPVLMRAIQTKGANNSWTKTQNLPITTLTGKLNGAGESVIIFPDGLKKAGNVQDEIFVEDGVVKAIKRVGSVDLGSLTWEAYDPINLNRVMWAELVGAKHPSSLTTKSDVCCSKYIAASDREVFSVSPQTDKAVCVHVTLDRLYLYDSAYTDAATFKSAMNGIMLYYELETPEIYVLDPITDFVWYGIKNGQEVLADTLPWYVSGQGTDNLTVDAMYGENINVVLRCKMMDGETLSPSKAYATLSWRTPDIETFVQSDNGGAVRSDTEEMSFGTIVNVNGEVLSDALKQKHLAFNWKIHKDNAAPNTPEAEIDKGWGQRITIDASDLRNVRQTPSSTLASTLVYNHVYLKGAYEEVTDGSEVITDGGEVVYDRPVD